MSAVNLEKFDIRNFIHHLNVLKDEPSQYVCECPVCGRHRLTISKRTGSYQCWSGGCDCSDIREAVAPWDGRKGQTYPSRRCTTKPAKRATKLTVPPAGNLRLARLPGPATDSPQPQKHPDKEQGEVQVTIYQYSPNQWVKRSDWADPSQPKGRDKDFKQWHRDEVGRDICQKGKQPWPAYRLEEALQAATDSGASILLVAEGEKAVEAYRSIGLACITFQGSAWGKADLERLTESLKAAELSLVYHPDPDQEGKHKAKKVQDACERAGVPCVVIDPIAVCPELPESGDVVEMLAAMEIPEFILRLEKEIHRAVAAQTDEQRLNDPDERLKLDLQAILKESDPIRKVRLRSEICSNYRIPAKEIPGLLEHLERSHSTPKKTRFSFDEFFSQETEGLQWVVPGILPVAETVLLASQAKCGKTNLATDLIHAVLSGGNFLGEQVGVKGRVLLVSSDESSNTTRRRFRQRGIDLLPERSNLRIMTHLDISNLSELEAEVEDFRPRIVVIDSLTTICAELGVSEKDPEFARYIYRLKTVLGRYEAAGVVTHHENKDPLAKGINQVSGSARIPAAVWGVLQLKAVDPNNDRDPRRFLKLKPREGESVTLNLEINPKDQWAADGIFKCDGELGDESGQKKTQAERVLALLAKYSPKGLEYQEIDAALQIGKSLYTVLDRLEDRQLVTRRRSTTDKRRWVYATPSSQNQQEITGDTPPPSEGDKDVEEVAGTKTMQGVEDSQQLFNNYSTTIQQPYGLNDVLNTENPDAVSDLAVVQQNSELGGERGSVESAIALPVPASPSDNWTPCEGEQVQWFNSETGEWVGPYTVLFSPDGDASFYKLQVIPESEGEDSTIYCSSLSELRPVPTC